MQEHKNEDTKEIGSRKEMSPQLADELKNLRLRYYRKFGIVSGVVLALAVIAEIILLRYSSNTDFKGAKMISLFIICFCCVIIAFWGLYCVITYEKQKEQLKEQFSKESSQSEK